MYLKSLTLKGFKSFASATTLRFEPGITCVVGPNGSGKSNVLDALSWVMGQQGAKALRGGKMEDVIFAGTSGRAPLGRAEVTLTIDNSDGSLPIDYTEVSITRRMFREGANEYELNGSACRLLDIQELLSDSGIGREMHVIVGQGRLAAILESKPEERRAFIEEAAGVLKHRKRKEKAIRKLDAMQANLTRLTDLTAELRRQLKPLGKQAEIARRAQAVQAELRDARLRLIADELVNRRYELARDEADESAARVKRAEVEESLRLAEAEMAVLEEDLAADAPRVAATQDTWYRLSALEERLRGTVRLAVERHRHLAEPAQPHRVGRDPEELEAEAEQVAVLEEELAEGVETAREELAAIVEHRGSLEHALAAAEREHLAAVRAVADRREGVARLSGQVEALRSKVGATDGEIERLSTVVAEATERAGTARLEFEEHQARRDLAGDSAADLDERVRFAEEELRVANQRVDELVAAERTAERDIASWKARVDALSLGLNSKDGAGALLAAGGALPGLLGSVAALLTVEPGHEVAMAAALGAVADALAVAGPADAVAALELLKRGESGRAGLLVSGTDGTTDRVGPVLSAADRDAWPPLPGGAGWAADLVSAPESLRPALCRVLNRLAVVPDLATAGALIEADPSVRAVTADGDLVGADWATGGSGRDQSVIEVRAAVDEAEDRLGAARRAAEAATAALAGARAGQAACRAGVKAVADERNEARVAAARTAEVVNRLRQAATSAAAEVERATAGRAGVEAARERDLARLSELETRLAAFESEPLDAEPDSDIRDEIAERLGTARRNEMDARLALRTAEERARALAGRAEGLSRQARAEREARARAEAESASRARGAEIADAVIRAGEAALERIAASLALAVAERDQAHAARAAREQAVARVRLRVRDLSGEMDKLTSAVHRDEVLRAERRMRVEQLEQKVADEFGVGLEDLVTEYGPDVVIPPTELELREYEQARERGERVTKPVGMPFDRDTQERRAGRAEKDLSLLGRVNPLALEEFAALEERHQFLSTQLEDLKATRRDLMLVVKEVDEKILEVFASAFEDVAREFEIVFTTLFPGGEGRLTLTDPDDLLTTGVELEARPPGKKVKRLSLLSGGEKSLCAVAMLVSIFRARPSPFYIMDEVEAALDDTNLRRLISLFEQLRERSQLLIITHQKPTMEIADALYGVSMRGDGISQVISQRLGPTRAQAPSGLTIREPGAPDPGGDTPGGDTSLSGGDPVGAVAAG